MSFNPNNTQQLQQQKQQQQIYFIEIDRNHV